MNRQQENKELKNYFVVILDRSGSMTSVRREAVDALNKQVKTIKDKSKGMKSKVGLVTFSSDVDVPNIWLESPGSLNKLKLKDYSPDGMTALYDAIGMTIHKLKKVKDAGEDNVSFHVIIITDGEENNSKHYSAAHITKRIKDCEATGRWTFSYLGANQDISKVGVDLGLNKGNMATFVSSVSGMTEASDLTSQATENYLSNRSMGGKKSTDFFSSVVPSKKVH